MLHKLHSPDCRAVAAGPVSLVSTRPLLPSLVACLALPISDIAWRTPTQRPKVHRYHAETCEMAANSATELFRKSSNNYNQTISLVSFTSEECGFWPITEQDWKADTIGVRCNGQNGIHVKLCRLASKLEALYWPKIGPRSNLIAPKFSWRSMPPGPPRV